MQLEIGKIYEGKIKGIAQYGAFVEIPGAGTGMVHISEVANTFVKDVKDHISVNQTVLLPDGMCRQECLSLFHCTEKKR